MGGFDEETLLVGDGGIGKLMGAIGEGDDVVVSDYGGYEGGDISNGGFGVLGIAGAGVEVECEYSWY